MARNTTRNEKPPTKRGPELDRLLTTDEVAEYLQVPRTTLYGWRYHNDGPPSLRVGRHVRYRRDDLDRWVQSRVSETT